jgi:uncharacterized repeat protein (TIGR03943 family)
MNRETQSLVTLLVGGMVLRIATTDMYLRYVKAGLKPYLLVSAVLLIVIGTVSLARDLWLRFGDRNPGRHRVLATDQPACADHHGHDGGGPKSAWLLVVPILALLLISPPSLGSYAASRSGSATSLAKDRIAQSTSNNSSGNTSQGSLYPALPAGNPVQLPVLDYAARAVFDKGISLQHRNIKLIGFVTPGPHKTIYLTRMILVCCAADARPIKVGLTGKLAALKPKADQWIEVVGKFNSKQDTDTINQEKIPYLTVKTAHTIQQPANPYDS